MNHHEDKEWVVDYAAPGVPMGRGKWVELLFITDKALISKTRQPPMTLEDAMKKAQELSANREFSKRHYVVDEGGCAVTRSCNLLYRVRNLRTGDFLPLEIL